MTESNVIYIEICRACEHIVGEMTPTCNLCACPIDYLTVNAKCPIDKWTAITPEE